VLRLLIIDLIRFYQICLFKYGRNRTWPDLGTHLAGAESGFGENLFWDHRTMHLMKLMPPGTLSAAIKI